MAYIRSKKEELTGYQASGEIRPSVDLGCDFIMVYGIDPTMPERIRQYREKGYVIHLMTGIAWGEYQEYLDGKWDGRKHWDEGQVDRNGPCGGGWSSGQSWSGWDAGVRRRLR